MSEPKHHPKSEVFVHETPRYCTLSSLHHFLASFSANAFSCCAMSSFLERIISSAYRPSTSAYKRGMEKKNEKRRHRRRQQKSGKNSLQLHRRSTIMAKLHRKLPLSLRRRPQLATKPKHTIQAAIGIQREILRPNLRIANNRIPLIE